jgi:hypothetical protein
MEKYFSLSFNIIDKNLFLITGDLKIFFQLHNSLPVLNADFQNFHQIWESIYQKKNFSFDLVPGLRTKYSAILLS